MSLKSYIQSLVGTNQQSPYASNTDSTDLIMTAVAYDPESCLLSVINTTDIYNTPILNIPWTPTENAGDYPDPGYALDTFHILGVRDLGPVTPEMLYDQIKFLEEHAIIKPEQARRLNLIVDQRKYIGGGGTGESDNPHWMPQILVQVKTNTKDWPQGAHATDIINYLSLSDAMYTTLDSVPAGNMLPNLSNIASNIWGRVMETIPGINNIINNINTSNDDVQFITDTNHHWVYHHGSDYTARMDINLYNALMPVLDSLGITEISTLGIYVDKAMNRYNGSLILDRNGNPQVSSHAWGRAADLETLNGQNAQLYKQVFIDAGFTVVDEPYGLHINVPYPRYWPASSQYAR